MSYTPGRFVWFEHLSNDIPKARAFYEKLFGWNAETMPMAGTDPYVMIHNGNALAMWQVARRYTLADNFFMGAFGGSFLNHQYLVCACAPEYPDAERSPAKDLVSVVETDARGRIRLVAAAEAASSALAGAPRFRRDGDLTPKDDRGMFYAVNTMQPAYQPSGVAPAAGCIVLTA